LHVAAIAYLRRRSLSDAGVRRGAGWLGRQKFKKKILKNAD
jgi:hypothetical protein